ncbi:MAG: glycosyltransferase family 2 protein [Candidatus Helarchaeota archaeon]
MLSVIVPTKLERQNLEDCLRSINNQILKPDETILVITSDDKEKIKDIKEKFDVKVLIEKRIGLSYSRNSAILNAIGDIITFIDDDAIADKNWLKFIVKSHKIKNIGIVGGRIEPIWPKTTKLLFKSSVLSREWLSLLDLGSSPIYIDRVIGCNFSLKREVFDQIGEFDTSIGKYVKSMYGGEETEFCERANKKYKVLYCPKAIVYHKISSEKLNFKWFIKRSHDSGYSKAKRKRVPKVIARNSKFNFFDYSLMFPYLIGYIKGRISKF